MYLDKCFPREIAEAKENRTPVVMVGGTVEYHGPHCAYGCDTLIAEGLVAKLSDTTLSKDELEATVKKLFENITPDTATLVSSAVTPGFIKKNEVGTLFLILLGNILGCFIASLLARVTPMAIQEAAQKILGRRLRTGAIRCGLLGIGCGFIMTTAVQFARQKQYLPLLFGVPLFIVCGFTHCVADAFYYLCVPIDFWMANALDILTVYISIVLGNLIGCNLYRIVLAKDQYE